MFFKARIFLYLMTLTLLSGCWIPEQFDAKVVFNKDGSYTFSYDGTLAFPLALAAEMQGGWSAKEEAGFRQETTKFFRDPIFKRVDYLGKGRFKVSVEKHGKRGEPYYFLSKEDKIFSVQTKQDGTVSVSAISTDKKSIQELTKIGAKVEGTLTVSVASGSTVLNSNAQGQPSVFGLFGDYKWKIKSPSEKPFIDIQPIGGNPSAKKVGNIDAELFKAVSDGNLGLVKSLILDGADVNAKDSYNAPILRRAENIQIFKMLLAKGADVNAKSSDGMTALDFAIAEQNGETVEILLNKGADMNLVKGGDQVTAGFCEGYTGGADIVQKFCRGVTVAKQR